MIKLKNIEYTTLLVARRLDKKEQQFLAGDIENWLLTQKGIKTDIEII